MAKAILNYTTTISVQKTAGEIQEILASAGANRVIIEYGTDHQPDSISFQIKINSQTLAYRLPSRWRGVYESLKTSSIEKRYKTEEQARRVAWRIVKDQIEVEAATIEAGIAEITEIFLPYMLVSTSSETVYDTFRKTGFMLLDGPKENA